MSCASLAISSSYLNLSPSSPVSNLNAQPPRALFSDQPGSSITPSRVTNSVTTSLPMVDLLSSPGIRLKTIALLETHRSQAYPRRSSCGERLEPETTRLPRMQGFCTQET